MGERLRRDIRLWRPLRLSNLQTRRSTFADTIPKICKYRIDMTARTFLSWGLVTLSFFSSSSAMNPAEQAELDKLHPAAKISEPVKFSLLPPPTGMFIKDAIFFANQVEDFMPVKFYMDDACKQMEADIDRAFLNVGKLFSELKENYATGNGLHHTSPIIQRFITGPSGATPKWRLDEVPYVKAVGRLNLKELPQVAGKISAGQCLACKMFRTENSGFVANVGVPQTRFSGSSNTCKVSTTCFKTRPSCSYAETQIRQLRTPILLSANRS